MVATRDLPIDVSSCIGQWQQHLAAAPALSAATAAAWSVAADLTTASAACMCLAVCCLLQVLRSQLCRSVCKPAVHQMDQVPAAAAVLAPAAVMHCWCCMVCCFGPAVYAAAGQSTPGLEQAAAAGEQQMGHVSNQGRLPNLCVTVKRGSGRNCTADVCQAEMPSALPLQVCTACLKLCDMLQASFSVDMSDGVLTDNAELRWGPGNSSRQLQSAGRLAPPL